MNTWTPLFSKIVDSSLWSEEDWVVKVFLTLLALKDADQVVRVNAYGIGRKCWPTDDKAEKKVLDALKILSSPDKRRLEPQPHEGRRIQKVEGGWFILNGLAYENMMRKINRREYQRKWMADARAAVKDNRDDLIETLDKNSAATKKHANELRIQRDKEADEAAKRQRDEGIL